MTSKVKNIYKTTKRKSVRVFIAVDFLCLGSGDYNSAVKVLWVGNFAFSLFNHAAV